MKKPDLISWPDTRISKVCDLTLKKNSAAPNHRSNKKLAGSPLKSVNAVLKNHPPIIVGRDFVAYILRNMDSTQKLISVSINTSDYFNIRTDYHANH